MDMQALDLSVSPRNRKHCNTPNFDDRSDSGSSHPSSPLDTSRCGIQLYNEYIAPMRLPNRVKSLTDGSGQSDEELEASPPQVHYNYRVKDDKVSFRTHPYSPIKMARHGYEVSSSPFQNSDTIKWIHQSQNYFLESRYNFDQFRIKNDSKINIASEHFDASQNMNYSALDLSNSTKKEKMSPVKQFMESVQELQSVPNDDISELQRSYKTSLYQTDRQIDIPDTLNNDPVPSPLRYDAPSSPNQDSVISKTVGGITVTLHESTLWNTFRKHGTEMIINRNGRRMFPHLDLSLQGLNPSRLYNILLEVCPADNKRYKFINNKWTPVGMADPMLPNPPVLHHDSPNIGSFWMGKLSFAKIKITNHKDSNEGMIVLQSMHKYMIKVIIQRAGSDGKGLQDEIVIPLEETAFFAVTAYQNETIIQLKIHNNPFAKAFRDHRIGQPSRSKHNGKNLTEISNIKSKSDSSRTVSNKRRRYDHLDKSKKVQCVEKSPPSLLSLASVLSDSPHRSHESAIPPYFGFNGLPYMGFGGLQGYGLPSFIPSMVYPPQSWMQTDKC